MIEEYTPRGAGRPELRTNVLGNGSLMMRDWMGYDLTPVEAARVSFDSGLTTEERDLKLLNYLYESRHTSPFEHVVISWVAEMPIFVAREWVRHRTASINEFSMRYAEAYKMDQGLQFYWPEGWRAQDTKNKQSSSGLIDDTVGAERLLFDAYDAAAYAYAGLLDLGVAREMARIVLPVGVLTKWWWTNDLHNTFHFLRLRNGSLQALRC